MRRLCIAVFRLLSTLVLSSALAPAMSAQDNRTLTVNGQSVPVVQQNGRSYVDLEALARATNASLSFSGNQMTLMLPGASTSPAQQVAPAPPANHGFSRDFLRTAIEGAATIREWHSALASAIQNGYPISADAFEPFRAQAATAMHLVSVAATTSSDQSAAQLLNNLLANVGRLSDKYVGMRAKLTYIDPNALRNDSLEQRIIACGRSLSSMAGTGQFADDGSCH